MTDDTELLLVAGANELPIAEEYKKVCFFVCLFVYVAVAVWLCGFTQQHRTHSTMRSLAHALTLSPRSTHARTLTQWASALTANPYSYGRTQAHGGAELVTRESVGWAAAVLLSRAFSLDLAEEEPMEGDM